MSSVETPRTRVDMCPGVLRPWSAEDGLLVRLRLVGGHLSGAQLRALLGVAERFGDGDVHLTSRANLQLRGLAGASLSEDAVQGIEATGLLPSRSHELVRNILMSPQSGFGGGRADLRPVARELDRLLLADAELTALPARFLFVLDDGRGDVLAHPCDLGLVALDQTRVQLRIGDGWGRVVALEEAAGLLVALARDFVTARGSGPTAPWHVRELSEPLAELGDPEPDLPLASPPPAYGPVLGGLHHAVPAGRLSQASAARLLEEPLLVVTPWRGIFIPDDRSSND